MRLPRVVRGWFVGIDIFLLNLLLNYVAFREYTATSCSGACTYE